MRWKQRRRQNHTIWRVENKKCTVPNRTLTHTHTHRPVVNKNHSKTKYNMATRSILQTIWTIVFVVKAKLKISVFFWRQTEPLMSLPQDTLNGLLYKYDLCIIRCLTENSQMTTENAKVFFKIMSMESMLSSVLFDSILFYYSSFELVRLVLFNANCFAVLQAHSQYGHPLKTKYRNKKKCYTRLNKAIVSIKKRAN